MKQIFIFLIFISIINAGMVKVFIQGSKFIVKRVAKKNFAIKNFKSSLKNKKYFFNISPKEFVNNINYYQQQAYQQMTRNLNAFNKSTFEKTSKNIIENTKALLTKSIRNKRSSNYRDKALAVTKNKKGGWVKDPYSNSYCRLKDMQADHVFPVSWGGVIKLGI